VVFKGLLGLGSLLKQAQQISGRMQGLGDELKKRRAVGSAGGGMVEIEVNGLMEVLRCHIDPELIARGDRELIEDLVATAINQTIAKGKQLHSEAVKELTGNVDMPGLNEALEKFLGAGQSEPEDPEGAPGSQ